MNKSNEALSALAELYVLGLERYRDYHGAVNEKGVSWHHQIMVRFCHCLVIKVFFFLLIALENLA